jgi:hypothetical protein
MRAYSVPLDSPTTVAAQVDIFEIAPAAEKPIVLLGFELGQTSEVGDAQEEMLELTLKIVTGAPTSGSGGSTRTPRPALPNDSASDPTTIEVYNTTKLTGGTTLDYKHFLWNVRMPLLYVPIPEARIVCAGGEHLVLELIKTPADTIDKISGWVEFAHLV